MKWTFKWLDRMALAGMPLGIGLMLQPWFSGVFRVGFFTTMAFTILHIVTLHVNKPEEE